MDVTVREAKAQFSRLLRLVEAGAAITIRRDDVPVAILVRAPESNGERDTWGDVDGELGPDFDQSLSDFAGALGRDAFPHGYLARERGERR